MPVVKNLPTNAGDARDVGSTHELGRSPGVGNGTPLSILVWKIPRTEETSGLQSTGPKRVVHDCELSTHTHTGILFIVWWLEIWFQCSCPRQPVSPTHHKGPKLRRLPELKALMEHLLMSLLRRMDIIKMYFLASFISLFFLTNEASLNKHSYTNLSELLRWVNIISLLYIFLFRAIKCWIVEGKYLQRKCDLIKN